MSSHGITERTIESSEASRAERGGESFGRRLARVQALNWAPVLLVLLLNVSFGLRLLWLDKPDGALIFDERYYVNAARVILGWPVATGEPYFDAKPGLDPNTEHPPGAKLLIAGSMRVLGDNAFGWRLPGVVLGTLSIACLYGIVRRLGGSQGLALLASFVYAFDNLVFVHSRIATLDIFLVTFLLLGIYLYLAGYPTLAGLAFVAATLCKIQGIYGLAAVIAFEGLRLLRSGIGREGWHLQRLYPLLITSVVYIVALPWLLGTLDSLWSSYKNPVEHVRHIFDYGFALTRAEGPQGDESSPWQWLLNEVPMTYLRTDVQVMVGDEIRTSRPVVFFRGAMNPYVIFVAPLAIAYAAYAAFKYRDDGSFMALALFVVTYAPFWPAALLAHRISYLFYFLPVIPAVAIAAAQLMNAPQVPRAIRWSYIAAVLLGFYGYFPFRQIP